MGLGVHRERERETERGRERGEGEEGGRGAGVRQISIGNNSQNATPYTPNPKPQNTKPCSLYPRTRLEFLFSSMKRNPIFHTYESQHKPLPLTPYNVLILETPNPETLKP